MADVAVQLPFRLELDVLEVADRHPSLQLSVLIVDDRTSGALSFRDTIWIAQGLWSGFLDRLATSSFGAIRRDRAELALSDLSKFFHFGVGSADGDAVLFRTSYAMAHRGRRLSFEIVERIDDDAFGHMQRAFAACPVR